MKISLNRTGPYTGLNLPGFGVFKETTEPDPYHRRPLFYRNHNGSFSTRTRGHFAYRPVGLDVQLRDNPTVSPGRAVSWWEGMNDDVLQSANQPARLLMEAKLRMRKWQRLTDRQATRVAEEHLGARFRQPLLNKLHLQNSHT